MDLLENRIADGAGIRIDGISSVLRGVACNARTINGI